MGQGVHTVLRQMLRETLDLPPERIRVYVCMERELDTGQTTASRATVLGGQAVLAAAEKLKGALDGQPLKTLAGQEFPGEFVVDRVTTNEVDEPVTHLAYAWVMQVAILDDEGRLTKVVAAHEAGRAMDPTLVEGQIEGAVHMGLGDALSEEFVVEEGVPITTTLKSLRIIPSNRHAGRRVHSRRGASARRPCSARRGSARRRSCRRPRLCGARSRRSTASTAPSCR